MGSQTKYKAHELVYVPAKIVNVRNEAAGTTTTLKYIFGTNIPTSDRTELGHVAVTEAMIGSPPAGSVLGCSFPKPPRAGKRSGVLRYTSSFYDIGKALALKKNGWRLTKTKALPKLKLASDTQSLVQTVYVTINGVNYAWNPPKVSETNITATVVAALGIKIAVASDLNDLVWGANRPKPPRASTIKVEGDDVKTLSTFYDNSVSSLPADWSTAGAAKISLL